jgi:D-arabinose 1-dehydrogenase-like Zn-dependent alcohol dehydrogenase
MSDTVINSSTTCPRRSDDHKSYTTIRNPSKEILLKCYELQGPSGIDGLTLVDKPAPQPGEGQVLVRLKSATLNYRDLLIIKGGYGSRQKFPLVPLSDGAGLIEAVGSGVQEFAVGDRVIGSFFESWVDGEPSDPKMRAALGGAVDGVLAEYRLFTVQALVKTPEHLSDIEAAALPRAGLTAWSAVVKLGDVKPGQTVLTQGTGGVSLFALQFAKMCGARVIATSSSDAKIERLQLLYALAFVPINYAGAALVLLGVVLMVAEAHIGAFRRARVGGIAAFVIGSLMMFPAHTPGFALSTGVVAGAAIGGAALLLFVLDGRGDEARSAGPLDARITRSDRAHRQGWRFVPVARRSAMGYV